MGIGKKIFLMTCILFTIFTVNINAGQERDNAISEVRNGKTVSVASASDSEQCQGVNNPIKPEVAHKMKKLQIPFIANDGQADETVKFYANTFAGSVFVTKDGEIVYSLPGKDSGQETRDKMREAGSKNQDSRYKRQEERIPALANSSFLNQIVYPNQQGYTKYLTHDTQCMFNILHQASCFWPPMCACYLLTKYNTHTESESITKGLVLKEKLIGSKISEIKGEGSSATKVSYFKGNDPSKWKNNIATYELVNLGEVYKGIDLKINAYGNNVEKLFTVKPGANPELIKISLSGSKDCGLQNAERGMGNSKSEFQNLSSTPNGDTKLLTNEHGELVVETELGPVKFTKPIAYQMIDGKRVEVECKYAIVECEEISPAKHTKEVFLSPFLVFLGLSEILNPKLAFKFNLGTEIDNTSLATRHASHMYGFKVASFDKTKDLIIDPLLASTFFGGNIYEQGNSIALDSSGNVFVTGLTGYQEGENFEVFVVKLSNDLTSLLASTFLGGNTYDNARGIALDSSDNVFVVGDTYSVNYPTTLDAYDTTHNGNSDVFVSKFSNDLTSLLASTFLGGNSYEGGNSIALDSSDNVFVTGNTSDVFVSKLSNDLTILLASTYLGGTGVDSGLDIAFDSKDNVFVTGNTFDGTTDMPATAGAYNESHNGRYDVFISKFSNDLTGLLASTFLGGNGHELAYDIALNSSGSAFVVGFTFGDFPTTADAFDTTLNGVYDVFVSKFSNDLTSLLESTYLGGSTVDVGQGIVLDSGDNIFVTGYTYDGTIDLPTTSGAFDESHNGSADVFVSKFDNLTISPDPTPELSPEPPPTLEPTPQPSTTEPPTAIEIVSFKAKANGDGSVTLKWETATEVDNAGFNIYRSGTRNGNYTKLNSALIPSKGKEVEGASYSYIDTPSASGTYYYQMEDVDYNAVGTMHGPVRVRN